MKTLILAEPGSTGEGRLDLLHRLIDTAADCGADAFKNQWLSNAKRLCARRRAPEYEWSYAKLAWPAEWHEELRVHCQERGLAYICTTYLPEDIHVVAPWVDLPKIASFEASDHHFIKLHREFHRRLIVSTGMMSLDEVYALPLEEPDYVLHCVSAYPAPLDAMHLGVIRRLDDWRPLRVGLSDHTRHPWTGALAVAAGAVLLERHFRLDDTDPKNADYEVASAPHLFAEYIANVRLAERMLGNAEKAMTEAEQPFARYRVGGVPATP